MSSLRARLTPLRVVLAVLVLGFGTVVLTGGLWSSPSAEPTVQQFLLAWQQHSYASAAVLTTGNTAEAQHQHGKDHPQRGKPGTKAAQRYSPRAP